MSKFKKGDIVEVSKSSNKVLRLLKNKTQGKGEIINIVKGSYDKSTKKYVLDKYFVLLDNGVTVLECAKKDLTKISVTPVVSDNKETTFYYHLKMADNHVITVVGVRTEEKEQSTKIFNLSFKNGDVQTLHNFKVPVRRFVLGYSICHPEDVFDTGIGIEGAYNRAKSNNRKMGELRSNNWTMLQDDQCELLVKCEAEHIGRNLHKYINRK